jgi:hypothetical protein
MATEIVNSYDVADEIFQWMWFRAWTTRGELNKRFKRYRPDHIDDALRILEATDKLERQPIRGSERYSVA